MDGGDKANGDGCDNGDINLAVDRYMDSSETKSEEWWIGSKGADGGVAMRESMYVGCFLGQTPSRVADLPLM